MADEIDSILGAQPGTPATSLKDHDLDFLKPGFRRAPAAAPGDEIDDILGTGEPDRIGQAATAYRQNLAGLKDVAAATGETDAANPYKVHLGPAASFAGGLEQGATLGFADELEGGARAIGGTFTGEPGSFTDRYRKARDEARAAYADAQATHPGAYMGGELAGGIATAPLVPTGGPAKTLAKSIVKQAVAAGTAGAVQGFGASNADLTQGEFGQAFRDAGVSGAVGGITGGILGAAGGKVVQDAEKNATGWVIKDIAGEAKGASTATARKQLADDAENAGRLMRSDKGLDQAINSARHGGVDELKAAKDAIDQRLNAAGSKLDPMWNEVDKTLPQGGVRAGDLAEHLAQRIEDLRATGLTSDAAEADALEGIRNRVTKARDFGAKTMTQPSWAGGKKTVVFDPDYVVSSKQVQRLWSDESGIAYNSQGGINGTATFQKKLDVASHLRDFRDDILKQAEAKNPDVISKLRSTNSDYSALKRMQTVIDQRLNAAQANAGGASFGANVHSLGRKLMHGGGLPAAAYLAAHGHYGMAAASAAAPLALAGKRALDRGVAGVIRNRAAETVSALMARGVPQEAAAQIVAQQGDGALASRILSFMQRGLPQAAAIQAARAASPDVAAGAPIEPPAEPEAAPSP